jgi:hypothetical protein
MRASPAEVPPSKTVTGPCSRRSPDVFFSLRPSSGNFGWVFS